ncbi:MAG: terpene cyclase/mutase family protein [Dehalococcoidales bacterium]|nr:terpene cyclase/mutase family protein [Dehalococcoidales bacterium]
MEKAWPEKLRDSTTALLAAGNEAIMYFTRRDLLGETVAPLDVVWSLPEPRKIFRKQSPDGFWAGPLKKTPEYPENHARLTGTFKSFRELVEKYRFTRDSTAIEKAAGFLLSFQTDGGDIRGFIGNQYATYYTGYILSLLIQAGYVDDPRIEKGMKWLLAMRQNDGGWTIPILTHYLDGKTMYKLTSSYTEPLDPDRSQPFSHNWTDMVLRAFAAHPVYRQSQEARSAGELLKSRFFQPDVYSSYQAAGYWTRFAFWWPNLLTAMESLSMLGFSADDPDINKGLQWFFDNRGEDGLWECVYGGKGLPRGKGYSLDRLWISMRICRMLKSFFGH